jgi:hypothetical protein
VVRSLWNGFASDYHNSFLTHIQSTAATGRLPPVLESWWAHFSRLMEGLSAGPNVDGPIELSDEVGPALKLIILTKRRKYASSIDERKAKVSHHELTEQLDSELHVKFDSFMKQDWLQEPLPFGRLQSPF